MRFVRLLRLSKVAVVELGEKGQGKKEDCFRAMFKQMDSVGVSTLTLLQEQIVANSASSRDLRKHPKKSVLSRVARSAQRPRP